MSTERALGRMRSSRNFNIGTLPAFATSMALRTSSISSFLRRASATTVVLFLEPGLRPALPFWNGRPRRRGASGGMISDFFELIGVQPNHTHRSYSELSRRPVAKRRQSCRRHGTRHRVNPAYLREWGFPRPSRFLATLRARGPYPLLAISGELGSAKTVLSKMLKALIDTSAAPVRTLPREERELMIAANNGYLLAFDKLSGLPPGSRYWGERREFRGAAALYRRRRGRSPGRLHLRKHGHLAIVQNISQQHSTERAFNKLTRTFATQMEALKRPDRRGAEGHGAARANVMLATWTAAIWAASIRKWQSNLETMDAAVHVGNNRRCSGEY